ncbi:hypothetical protein HY333_01310 [Candidatus Collierbacteria bacterium]|nr:hypothetical protein [Candidatus Collierbacteria bacterium]
MTLTQTLSLISISLLTLIATIIGIQIIFILKEVRLSLSKINSFLNTTEVALNKLTHPLAGLAGLVESIKQSTKIIQSLGQLVSRNRPPEPPLILSVSETDEAPPPPPPDVNLRQP